MYQLVEAHGSQSTSLRQAWIFRHARIIYGSVSHVSIGADYDLSTWYRIEWTDTRPEQWHLGIKPV